MSHPVDLHVGKKIRARRAVLSISQQDLAKKVGVTFQQIQKYERGVNRVSASRLHEFSQALRVGIPYFFEGFYDSGQDAYAIPGVSDIQPFAYGSSLAVEEEELVQAYRRLKDIRLREHVLELVRGLADKGASLDDAL